jgi:signal transduction histidine kinase
LHDVLENLKDLYSTNPAIHILWQKVDGEVMMEADKTHMNRLFTNLLSNAIDACSEKDSCRIRMVEKREDDFIVIEIADNGEGIAEEMQSKIFTPNFTTKTSGTGLGLAMCKSIVEHAGGQIWFETEQGVGTSFFVQLPLL